MTQPATTRQLDWSRTSDDYIHPSPWLYGRPLQKVEAFDRDLAALLHDIAPQQFSIDHGVRVQIFQAL